MKKINLKTDDLTGTTIVLSGTGSTFFLGKGEGADEEKALFSKVHSILAEHAGKEGVLLYLTDKDTKIVFNILLSAEKARISGRNSIIVELSEL